MNGTNIMRFMKYIKYSMKSCLKLYDDEDCVAFEQDTIIFLKIFDQKPNRRPNRIAN